MTTQAIDEAKLREFMTQIASDVGAAAAALLAYAGDELGLYKAMDGAGPLTAEQLAAKTGTHDRSIREWLNAQAAGGYVMYDPGAETYTLPPEQAMALVNEESPVFVGGAWEILGSMWATREKIFDALRHGNGVDWGEYDARLFNGTRRYKEPVYRHNLVQKWIPSLESAAGKLEAGATVADVGCGHGASTVTMALAYPNSIITGFDFHADSLDEARKAAAAAGVGDRVSFEVASATDYPGLGYDLIAFLDCLHDMGDPAGAVQHARQAIAEEGTVLLVEPFAADRSEENHNAVGRLRYSFSTAICTQVSLAQEVGAAMGAQAGEAQYREMFNAAGFSHFRRVTERPFDGTTRVRPGPDVGEPDSDRNPVASHLVLEARP